MLEIQLVMFEIVYVQCWIVLLDNCWVFIDGTLRPCCRPITNQRILFSEHKRTDGLKFQVKRTAGQIYYFFVHLIIGC